MRIACLLCLLLCGPAAILPQAGETAGSGTADASSAHARQLLDAMVAALGGDRWLELSSRMYTGRSAGFYHGSPTGGMVDYWEFVQFPGGGRADATRVEFTRRRDDVQIFRDREGWEATYRGKSRLPDKQVEDWYRRHDHSIDAAIRLWLPAPGTLLFYEGQRVIERHLTDQVTLLNAANDAVTLFLDHDTHLPAERRFHWRDPVYKDRDEDVEDYDDYHLVEGIPTPFTITRSLNGELVNQRFLLGAEYDRPFPPDFFSVDAAAARIGSRPGK